MSALDVFSPATRTWFEGTFDGPTPAQTLGWPAIARGGHTLIQAPTGSGKTLAAFLYGIDRLNASPGEGLRLLYVSPLKALNYDVERNLRGPLAGLRSELRVAVRTGDTPQKERQQMLRKPPDILITTPESLFLLLTSQARALLRSVETLILDEVHAVAGTKRGAHLALSVERLQRLVDKPIQRIGLSATQRRLEVEELLKRGEIPCLVATSSLELGIDMGAVDLVLQVESPKSVARGLQRIGRAGHELGAVSKGRIFPKFRADLLEAAVVAKKMREGAIEETVIPRNPLDVLAQQIVAIVADDEIAVDDLHLLVKRAYPFSDLSRLQLDNVLDMLAGRYPSDEFAELRPRIVWDRANDTLRARAGARVLAVTSGGTIPDRGLYGVFTPEGTRVGELDEEMVYEPRVGETFVLGATMASSCVCRRPTSRRPSTACCWNPRRSTTSSSPSWPTPPCSPAASARTPPEPCCCRVVGRARARPCGSSASGRPTCSPWRRATALFRSSWRPTASACVTPSTCRRWSSSWARSGLGSCG